MRHALLLPYALHRVHGFDHLETVSWEVGQGLQEIHQRYSPWVEHGSMGEYWDWEGVAKEYSRTGYRDETW
jgi:hypothetical protein